MAEVINPLLINSQLIKLPENQNYIRIQDLPPEILSQLKVGSMAALEISVDVNGQLSAFLQTGDAKISINVSQGIGGFVLAEQSATFPVRIGTGGRLFLLQEQQRMPENTVMQLKASTSDFLSQIETAPLKLDSFVSKTLEQFGASPDIKEQTVRLLPQLEANLIKIGDNEGAMQDVLYPLQNVLRQIAEQPQNFDTLKHQLLQVIKNLSGMQIGGQVSERINEMIIIQTPLGKTLFDTKIRLPLSENVLLNIGVPTADILSEIKFMDNLLKVLFVPQPEKINLEKLAQLPQLKELAEITTLRPDILPEILRVLPFQGKNLLENMYRFYQGALNNDVKQWLGQKVLAEISQDTATDKAVVKELGTFLSNSLKETPNWRIVEMPFFDGNSFSSLKVAVKKDRDKEAPSRQDKKNGTRFIVETDFSKLGGFQFDGFSNVKHRSLDLIIRTTRAIDDDFCSNIINLFKKSLYSLDYTGTIKINRQQGFINLYDENQINTGIYI